MTTPDIDKLLADLGYDHEADKKADRFLAQRRRLEHRAEQHEDHDMALTNWEGTRINQHIDRVEADYVERHNALARDMAENAAKIDKARAEAHDTLVADIEAEFTAVSEALTALHTENETLKAELAALRADLTIAIKIQRGEIVALTSNKTTNAA
jgi:iron-sulfur cluster repair protein YtfE (RIC family)